MIVCKSRLCLGAAIAMLSLASAPVVHAGEGRVSVVDENEFSFEAKLLSELHFTNVMERRFGKLALVKSDTDSIEEYAEHLIADHSAADERLKELARSEGIHLLLPRLLEAEQRQAIAESVRAYGELACLDGMEFERRFLETRVAGHEKVLAKLDAARPQIEDEEIGAFLDELRPKIEHHKDMGAMILAQIDQ